MNFYALGPIAFLNHLIGPDYKYHMVLAQHLYDADFMPTDYFMFYKRRASSHKFHVILDNGTYEAKKLSYDHLLRATLELNPHVVVLPDVMHNMPATIQGGEAFKQLLKRHHWRGKTMTVVHGEPDNIDQAVHSYMEACKQSVWVGLPRNGDLGGLSRAAFMQELKTRKVWNEHNEHHALGMKDGSLEELKQMNDCGMIRSCDSSAPLWRGLQGYSLHHMEDMIWPDKLFDPNYVEATHDFEQAKENWEKVQT